MHKNHVFNTSKNSIHTLCEYYIYTTLQFLLNGKVQNQKLLTEYKK